MSLSIFFFFFFLSFRTSPSRCSNLGKPSPPPHHHMYPFAVGFRRSLTGCAYLWLTLYTLFLFCYSLFFSQPCLEAIMIRLLVLGGSKGRGGYIYNDPSTEKPGQTMCECSPSRANRLILFTLCRKEFTGLLWGSLGQGEQNQLISAGLFRGPPTPSTGVIEQKGLINECKNTNFPFIISLFIPFVKK